MLKNFKLSMRLLLRDWRAGELRLFVVAIVIAVGAVTTVGFFNDRLDQGLTQRSADLLGADLMLSSSAPAPSEWIDKAARDRLRAAQAVEFASVVVRGDYLQLASIRGVDPHYPLRGAIRTAPAMYEAGTVTRGTPALGTAWAEARVLQALALEIGQSLTIGNSTFTVTRVLTDEPGRVGNFFSLGPRVLIPLADVERTGVIQPGSRVTYRYAFAGHPEQIDRFRDWLKPQLRPSDRVTEPREGNPTTGRAIERINRYFGLTSLLAVILAGVAIAMGARRYATRHYDTSAMLRALGATQREVLQLYLPQLLVLAVAASALGCLVGLAAQQAVFYVVKDLFPVQLPAPGVEPALFGFATGIITLIGFALVPVLRLGAVPPLRVLRRELAPLPPTVWAVIGVAAAVLLALLWRYTGSWTLTFGVLFGAFAGAFALFVLTAALLRLSRRMKARSGSLLRQGLVRLQRRLTGSAGQIIAFGLTLMAMSVIALVRTDLLSSWQQQLPADAPNHFVFNILPDDVTPVARFFASHHIPSQALYPLVRGRLVTVNGEPLTKLATKEEGADADNAAMQRDLNFTWANQPPPDNKVTSGQWWSDKPERGLVSVEEKLAERLGIHIGDTLSFTIEARTLDARVTSLRKVRWESFHPNFFMIFSPGTLDDFPATYMTSFNVSQEQKPLLATLVRQFPAVTVLELDQFLNQVRSIVQQAALAVELVLLFVFAGGLTVLFAALNATLDERFYEGALLRTFGASRWQLRRAHIAEFVTLGLLAGVLAAVGTEAIAFVLYTRIFDIPYSFKWIVWIIAPLAGGALIGLAGFIGTRKVVEQSPLTVLREL